MGVLTELCLWIAGNKSTSETETTVWAEAPWMNKVQKVLVGGLASACPWPHFSAWCTSTESYTILNSEHLFCSCARLPVPVLSASDQLQFLTWIDCIGAWHTQRVDIFLKPNVIYLYKHVALKCLCDIHIHKAVPGTVSCLAYWICQPSLPFRFIEETTYGWGVVYRKIHDFKDSLYPDKEVFNKVLFSYLHHERLIASTY